MRCRASSRPTARPRWSRSARALAAEAGAELDRRSRAARPSPSPGQDSALGHGVAGYPDDLRARGRALPRRRCASRAEPATAGLEEAMRYSLLAGGKRIRPVLALATARAIGMRPAGGAPARGRDRADPHLLADPRRPAGDGRRRPAPRPADLPRRASARTSRSWPATALYAEAFRLVLDRAARATRRGCSRPRASWPPPPASTGWSAGSTSTSPDTRRGTPRSCGACTS